MRQPMPIDVLESLTAEKNLKLEELGEPALMLAEAFAARLYTGPLFVKYNGVLRGLDSEVRASGHSTCSLIPTPCTSAPFQNVPMRCLCTSAPLQVLFLKHSMIELCCPKAVYEQYMGGAEKWEEPKGTLSYEEVKKELNTYTTTLHAINSSIVKLGKLTVATKVFRGISGTSPAKPHLPRFCLSSSSAPLLSAQAACSPRSSGRPTSSASRAASSRPSCRPRSTRRWPSATRQAATARASSSRSSRGWWIAAPTSVRASPSPNTRHASHASLSAPTAFHPPCTSASPFSTHSPHLPLVLCS